MIGLTVGIIYAALELWFDRFGQESSRTLWFPVFVGVLVGIGVTLFHQNQNLNRALSTQNQNFRSRLLANTLLAHVLHEIRNPIHNLSALLEKSIHHLPASDREIAERNLKRLNETAEQLKRMNGPWDEISSRERTPFTDWLHQFLDQSVRSDLHTASIRYTESITPFIAHMHPLLMEQCFAILFQNAIQACTAQPQKRLISLHAGLDEKRPGYARIEIKNNGACFPESVLSAEAKRAVRSPNGMGIGLLLARDTLETVEGSIEITNKDGESVVVLLIPAEALL
jgi:signal transduction histidine kinase